MLDLRLLAAYRPTPPVTWEDLADARPHSVMSIGLLGLLSGLFFLD